MSYTSSTVYQIFRGIHRADNYQGREKQTTPIMDTATNKADITENKSGLAIAIEDFTEKFDGFNGKSSSNVSEVDTKKGCFRKFFESIGIASKEKANIFEQEAVADEILENGNVYQNDIFSEAIAKDGGIRYAKNGDNFAKSALNFAKADIKAIEKPHSMSDKHANHNGKLDYNDINSYTDFSDVSSEKMKGISLDRSKKEISAKEYASYLLVTDGIDGSEQDGLISPKEAEAVKNMKDAELKEKAKEIYKKYF